MAKIRALYARVIGVIVIGALLTVGGTWYLVISNDHEAHDAAQSALSKIVEEVTMRMGRYEYGLRGARGAILMVGDQLNRQYFREYSQTRDLAREFPGSRGFGFIRRVNPSDVEALVASAKADGLPDFHISQIAPHEGELDVIQFIEPERVNASGLGLDIASEPERRSAALAALESGEVRITAPITFVQSVGKPRQSFLLFLPVYRTSLTPHSTEERLRLGYGWVYTPLLSDDVLSGIPLGTREMSLVLTDASSAKRDVPFFSSAMWPDSGAPSFAVFDNTRVFGREWRFQLSIYPGFLDGLHLFSPTWAAGAGAVLTLLFATLVLVVGIGRQRRQLVIEERARLAALVESSIDGIIGKTLDGIVTSWNAGAEDILGYRAADALGKRVSDLVIPEDYQRQEFDMLERIGKGERIPSYESRRVRSDGKTIDVSVTVSPIRSFDHRIMGISSTVRDISAQKRAESRIAELNAGLEQQVAERTRELRQLNTLLASVLQSATAVAIIATDTNGIIRIFNSGAEALLGYASTDLVGIQTPLIFHDKAEVAQRKEFLRKSFGKDLDDFETLVEMPDPAGSAGLEWTYVRKDGGRFAVTLVVAAMRDDAQNLTGYLGIAVDITRRKHAERELAAARDQLQLAADVAELGVWTWELLDDSLTWNERMFEIYGVQRQKLWYADWMAAIVEADRQLLDDALRDSVSSHDTRLPLFRVQQPSGQIRHVQASSRVERDASGRYMRITGINRDVTDQFELEFRLRQAKDDADAASAAKSSFLANMSHEIRTPMNAVLGMLDLLKRTDLDERQSDYASKARAAARSLLGLLNDILDYSKIEAGKLQLDANLFSLDALLRDLAVILGGNQGDKEVEVLFDVDPDIPDGLVGDDLRLQQVLINLAGNAIKFTHAGYVLVSIASLEKLQGSVRLRISVRDTGIGISEEKLESIFEGFTQAESSTTRRFGGSGLGLFICKKLVALMGGELQVETELGKGSTFWFEVELKHQAVSSLQAISVPLRVLIADDNALTADVMSRIASSIGCVTDIVHDGTAAVDKVRRSMDEGNPYDVVILDWRMPGLDGLQVARTIDSISDQRATPIIVMVTAYARAMLATDEERDGHPYAALVTKPITAGQLRDIIVANTSGKSASEGAMPLPAGEASVRRLEGLRLLIVEDNVLNRQVARELLEAEGATCLLAEGGLDAVSVVHQPSTRVDAILMDIQMPDIDGYEATRRIRLVKKFERVPIIAMTANASDSDRAASLAAGMDEHVSKPIDMDSLVPTIIDCIARMENAPHGPVKSSAKGDEIVENLESIRRRLGGDLSIVRNVLIMFLEQAGNHIDALSEEIDDGDRKLIAATLHTLRGMAATVGASALAQRAGDLERAVKESQVLPTLLVSPAVLSELRELTLKSFRELEHILEPETVQETAPKETRLLPSNSARRGELDRLLDLLRSRDLSALEAVETLSGSGLELDKATVNSLKDAVKAVKDLDYDLGTAIIEGLIKANYPSD